MKERLRQFIAHVTGGKMTEFADLMGWSPQYLHRLTRGGSIGVRPVVALLRRFPELNARWLLLGEGVMLESRSNAMRARLYHLLELERYMPVMDDEELGDFSAGRDDFPVETIERWERLLTAANAVRNAKITDAMERSKITCGHVE